MRAGAALAAFSLTLAPMSPVLARFSVHTSSTAPSFRIADSIGSFTPAAADAHYAASFGRVGMAAKGFHFTPSAAPGNRRAVTIAIRARVATPTLPERAGATGALASLAPTAYNLGVAVGWKRFALTGVVARVEGGLLPLDREAADLGLSFSGSKWSTRLQLGAERAIGARPRLIGADESYSVDLGGSYALSHNLELSGGVRYRMQHDRVQALADDRIDSQAIYIGTAFKF